MTDKDKKETAEMIAEALDKRKNTQSFNVSMKQVNIWVIGILAFVCLYILLPIARDTGNEMKEDSKITIQNKNGIELLTGSVDRMETKVDNLVSDVSEIKNTRYTSGDHLRNMVPYDMRIELLEEQMKSFKEGQAKSMKENIEIWQEIRVMKTEVLNMSQLIKELQKKEK